MSNIKISELATGTLSLSSFFAQADANGIAYKNTLEQLQTFLNTIGVVSFKGVLLAADASVTEDGIYIAGDTGTYTNNGGLVIDLDNNFVLISVTDTQTTFTKVEIPLNITLASLASIIDNEPTSGSDNLVRSGGTKKYIDNATEQDLIYLKDPSSLSDTEKAKYISVKDIKFDFTSGATYEDYEFGLVYLGKDDETFSSIWWMARRETSGDAWETHTMFTGGTELQVENNWLEVSDTWDGVVITLLVDTTLLQDSLITFARDVFENKTEFTNPDYLLHQKLELKADKTIVDDIQVKVDAIDVDLGNDIENKPFKSKSYCKDYVGTSFKKYAYQSGRNASTDLFENVDAPYGSNFYTKTTKIIQQADETVTLGADFDTSLLFDLMQTYQTSDSVGIFPVYFKASYYHKTTEDIDILIQHRIRTKIDGSFYLPFENLTLPPNVKKEVVLEINPEKVDWSDFNTFFDYYSIIVSDTTLESEVYVGEAELFFYDPLQRDSVKNVNGKNIQSATIPKTALDFDIADSNVKKFIPTKQNIGLAGSSITWSDGNLSGGFGGLVSEFIKKEIANYIGVSDATYTGTNADFSNSKLYNGVGKHISGLNSKVNFTITGDELAICQAIKRTTDFAKVQVKADGVVIGNFTNHNNTIGSDSDSFTGNGTDVKFELSHNSTYNHTVTVNGVAQTVKIHDSAFFSFPVGYDAVIVRKLNSNGDTIHIIWFDTPPANGHSIVVNYDYGRVITEELSTVGQTTTDSLNESNFGDGDTSFDPADPSSVSSGLEFRSINEDAFFIHKFLSKAEREIELEIIDGTNPYFIFNYATNKFHNFINAGIGGWTVNYFKNVFYPQSYKNLYKNFIPNVLITEFATNDDWANSSRRISRSVSDVSITDVKKLHTLEVNSITFDDPDYTVDYANGIIDSIDEFKLVSSDAISSGIVVGDLVRIGTYYGDNRHVAVRKVSAYNSVTGEIKWLKPLNANEILNIESLSDLVGAEVNVRDLSTYKSDYQEMIDNIRNASPQTKIIIAQAGLSNYFERQLWGYSEIHRDLCNENYNVDVIEITDTLQDYQENAISGLSFENITANNSDEYTLAKTGHWQGFKVWVGGEDVYGKDCYIKSGKGYKVNQSDSGSDLDVSAYNRDNIITSALELVFFQNKPSSGTIKVEYADNVWSADYTHPNSTGIYIYAQKYITSIKNNLK